MSTTSRQLSQVDTCGRAVGVKRAVGPGFFIADGLMLALALCAGYWARPSWSKRSAAIILGAVAVFAFASLGVAYARQSGAKAPDTIAVDGQPILETEELIAYLVFNTEVGQTINLTVLRGDETLTVP